MQVQVEYEWTDVRKACIAIKNGFFKDLEYNLENVIDVAKAYHEIRKRGWEGWTSTGHDSPFSGKAN